MWNTPLMKYISHDVSLMPFKYPNTTLLKSEMQKKKKKRAYMHFCLYKSSGIFLLNYTILHYVIFQRCLFGYNAF